jgi:hypothetical protein
LELTGIKLAGVVSDIFGVSGRAILGALIDLDVNPDSPYNPQHRC